MLQDEKVSTNALLTKQNTGSNYRSSQPSATAQQAVNNQSIQIKQNKKSVISQRKKQGKKSQTQFTSVLKFFNIIIGLGVVGFGVGCYTIFNDQMQELDYLGIILPGYIAFSGLLILLIECNIKFIVRNMRFLYNFIGRGLFNIYVGVMPLSMVRANATPPQNQTFQIVIYIMISLMCLIGVLYILSKIFCCAKQSSKKRRKRSSDQSQSDQE